MCKRVDNSYKKQYEPDYCKPEEWDDLCANYKYFDKDNKFAITEQGWHDIRTMASIVLHKYYYLNLVDADDLISTATIRVVEILSSGKYNPQKGNTAQYITRCLRNEMGNYLYRQKRMVLTDDDILKNCSEQETTNDDFAFVLVELKLDAIEDFLKRYPLNKEDKLLVSKQVLYNLVQLGLYDSTDLKPISYRENIRLKKYIDTLQTQIIHYSYKGVYPYFTREGAKNEK